MESPSAPFHRGVLLWQGFLLIASFLSFWSPSTAAQKILNIPVELVPPNAAEGKEVLLLARKLPEKCLRLDWFRGEIDYANNIVTLIPNPGNITNGPAHSGRETLYSNGSLLIQNLTVGDTRTYRIQVITVKSDIIYGNIELHVYELLPKPNITANNSRPMEQDSVVLMCEPERPGTIYQWLINTQPIQPSARLNLSPDKRTLTVLHVTRKDTGPYECESSNPVSVNHSEPFILAVLYGPDDPTFSPSKGSYLLGENLSLSCLTASNPPAQFLWFMGDKKLASTQTLSIPNLSLNDSGSYSCLVSNQATGLNRTASINITVLANPGLSPGAIAGILIGVLAGVALITALVYFLYVRKYRGTDDQCHLTENNLSASNHSQDHSENSSNTIEETVYSYLDFDPQKHRKKQIAVSPGTTATEVIYSEVGNN